MEILKQYKPIIGQNLSHAWALAFIRCWDIPKNTMAPALVHFENNGDENWELENSEIREFLDTQLKSFDVCSVNQSNIETVAGTIFPEMIWRRCKGDHEKLFSDYDNIWPLITKCSANSRGTYFRRLSAYGNPNTKNKVNQLKRIIEKWKKGTHTHSALQAGVFDPLQDHLKPGCRFQRFPCLQQIVFHPHGANGNEGMTIVAFYANQLLLEKTYGNYLGLYRLGKFMASAMNISFKGVTCVTSNLKLSDRSGKKRDCKSLKENLEKVLSDAF